MTRQEWIALARRGTHGGMVWDIIADWGKSDHYQAQRVKELEAERIAIQNDERVLTCAYCGHQYEPGTPVSNHKSLTEHIAVCPSHPMHKIVRRNRELRTLLERALDPAEDWVHVKRDIAEALDEP